MQTEKHVARPVCTREQQQRPASQGNRTEHRAYAAHIFTHTLSVSHTRTLTRRGSHLFAPHRHVVIERYTEPRMLQSAIPQHINVNGNTPSKTFSIICIIFLQLSTRTVQTHLNAWLVSPTIIHIAIYGEVCVCEGRRKRELGKFGEGASPWLEITRNTFMRDTEK